MIAGLRAAIMARLEGLKLFRAVTPHINPYSLREPPAAAVYLARDEAVAGPEMTRLLAWQIYILVSALPLSQGLPEAGDILDRVRETFDQWLPASAGMKPCQAPDIRLVEQAEGTLLIYVATLKATVLPQRFKL